MASIRKRPNGNGFSYYVSIRKKNAEIHKSFQSEEDAKLYAFYKETLIDNMKNFDIPLNSRVTLRQIYELKIDNIERDYWKKVSISDFEDSYKNIFPFIKENKFVCEFSYEEWLNAAKCLLNTDVFRGAKKEHTKRKMSLNTLRRHFASASSCFSFAQSQGLDLDNHPLKVIQTFITPLIKAKQQDLP